MINYKHNPEIIERAVLRVSEEMEKDKIGSLSWMELSDELLWVELVSCILGSRVRYETAKECTKHLYNQGLLSITEMLESPKISEISISKELSKPIFPPHINGKSSKYPFYKSKAQYIMRTVIEIHNNFECLKNILEISQDEYDAREKLTNVCIGIGHKQASLFLRNIGYSENLAILDTHIISYMELMELEERSKFIGSKNVYLRYENLLQSYADFHDIKLSILDFAIWTVMRVARRAS